MTKSVLWYLDQFFSVIWGTVIGYIASNLGFVSFSEILTAANKLSINLLLRVVSYYCCLYLIVLTDTVADA